MNILTNIKRMTLRLLQAAIIALPLSIFVSCDNVFYDYEGDCSVTYILKFRYDMNLKWADAFANEVSSVHLYAFNTDGVLVWQNEDIVEKSEAGNYTMPLDLPAGDYQLLAWCGLLNDGARPESFSVPEARTGKTTIEELQCSLNRLRDANGAYSKDRLYRLFHGRLDVSLPEDQDGGLYEYTMSLTKNTNHIRVILQHLSGEDVDVGQFNFRIDDENGLMAHHNGLLDDENITYRPWNTMSGEAGIGKEDTRAIINVRGAIADLTVPRLMEDHRKKMILTITDSEGELVAHIPVIDYSLLAKGYYEEEYGHRMDDQEFLDREDDYVLTFFLDESNQWIKTQVLIHSWVVVPQDINLE